MCTSADILLTHKWAHTIATMLLSRLDGFSLAVLLRDVSVIRMSQFIKQTSLFSNRKLKDLLQQFAFIAGKCYKLVLLFFSPACSCLCCACPYTGSHHCLPSGHTYIMYHLGIFPNVARNCLQISLKPNMKCLYYCNCSTIFCRTAFLLPCFERLGTRLEQQMKHVTNTSPVIAPKKGTPEKSS